MMERIGAAEFEQGEASGKPRLAPLQRKHMSVQRTIISFSPTLHRRMIIRTLLLRHGRLALPKTTSPSRYRNLATALATPRVASPPIDTNNPPPSHQIEVRDPSHPVAQDYLFFQHQKAHTNDVGSTLGPHYRPYQLLSNPPRPQDITLELLMASQAHIGHATSLWNPSNAKYIFGIRGRDDPIHIISLDVTAAYLRRACRVVKGVTERGGLVLFVGTRKHQERIVVKAAKMAQGCHLFNRWISGSITNGQQILGKCRKMVVDENDIEVLGFGDQLERSSAIKPDLVVCLNPLENHILLHECGLHNIPTIGIIDTDANPTWVTYPIPANDDSLRCVQVICGTLGRAGEEGQEIRLKKAQQGILTFMHGHNLEQPTQGQAEKEKEIREREALLAQQDYEERGVVAPIEEALDRSSAASDMGEDGYTFQSYERDRPLSAEELAQASESERRLADWEVAELAVSRWDDDLRGED